MSFLLLHFSIIKFIPTTINPECSFGTEMTPLGDSVGEAEEVVLLTVLMVLNKSVLV